MCLAFYYNNWWIIGGYAIGNIWMLIIYEYFKNENEDEDEN